MSVYICFFIRISNCQDIYRLKIFRKVKHKAVILYHLENKTLRYNEIRKKIPSITDKMLAQQLRELETDNLIIRKVYPVVPPKTEYTLSELGKTLIPILNSMCEWGQQFM